MTGKEQIRLTCLYEEVTVQVDSWGVSHIRAANEHDLFVAQGFIAARDRLYQLDLWRRRGRGRLSAAFGPDYIEQDRANRLLQYRDSMDKEWAAYAPGTRQIVGWFVEGVNTWIDMALSDRSLLPPEFEAADYIPERWDSEDVVRSRTHGLLYNAESELARALTIRDAGYEVEDLRQHREPADPLVIPEDLDLEKLSNEMLATYRLAFAPVAFAGVGAYEAALAGSNNWVVAGTRTKTGRPLLANDPHRAVTVPSLRYVVHLSSPSIDVIGAGEPALPGVSIGHNNALAFGLTIWPADQEDLVLYRLDPEDPERYLTADGWREFEQVEERIDVRGGDPVAVEHRFTDLGPVIHHSPVEGVALVLRAAWLEPGMAPYLGSLAYLKAETADEFVDALKYWGTPAVNQVFAAANGQIGWQAAAMLPRRRGWDGSVPVPGEGDYGWDGFLRAPELPRRVDPSSGWFATANQMNLPDDFDTDSTPIGYDWFSPARYERLARWLADDSEVTVARSAEMQWDGVNIHAVEALEMLQAVSTLEVRDTAVWATLQQWDGDSSADSIGATVFEFWFRRHFRPWLVADFCDRELDSQRRSAGQRLLHRDESWGGDLRADLTMIARLDVTNPEERHRLVRGVDMTLRSAVDELSALLGPDPAEWVWGRFHHVQLRHALLSAYDSAGELPGTLPRLPRAGSPDSPGLAAYGSDGNQTLGSTFRMVADVGNWDASVFMNAPGQSGDPRSIHYRDLYEPWAAGNTVPLVFSDQAVGAATQHTVTLTPGGNAHE